MRIRHAFLIAATLLAACSQPAQKPSEEPSGPPPIQAPTSDAPAGRYEMDLSHTSVNFRVLHLGLSRYTARFVKATGSLEFNPAEPAAQSVMVTIDARSLQTNYPDAAKLDFDTQVETEFLDAANHPEITFKSTKVEPTGPATAKVTGDLTLKGVTKPVTLDVTWNGGYKPMEMDPGGRVGFSARGVFKRSDFGITYGLPAPGTSMGVGDEIEVLIEAEFTGPTPAS